MEMLIDVFTDAAIDCIKMLPFLFLAFLLIEALEHYSSDFTKKLMVANQRFETLQIKREFFTRIGEADIVELGKEYDDGF